jgi:hypothetical protein
MRRNIGSKGFQNHRIVTVTAGNAATVLTPGATMVRVKLTSIASGASLLYRGVAEVEAGADPADTAALNASFCDVLNIDAPDSGWIDAQGSGVRVSALVGTVTARVSFIGRVKPVIA